VDIEPDVELGCVLKSMYLETATGFHVTRLTESSFIVSHRSLFGRTLWDAGLVMIRSWFKSIGQ
jgi:hypothetical protein